MSQQSLIQDTDCTDYLTLPYPNRAINFFSPNYNTAPSAFAQPTSCSSLIRWDLSNSIDTSIFTIISNDRLSPNPLYTKILNTSPNGFPHKQAIPSAVAAPTGTLITLTASSAGYFAPNSHFHLFLCDLLHNSEIFSIDTPGLGSLPTLYDARSSSTTAQLFLPFNYKDIAAQKSAHQFIFSVLKNCVFKFSANGTLEKLNRYTEDFPSVNFDRRILSKLMNCDDISVIISAEVQSSMMIPQINILSRTASIEYTEVEPKIRHMTLESVKEAIDKNFSVFRFYADSLPSLVDRLCDRLNYAHLGYYFLSIKNKTFFAVRHHYYQMKEQFETSALPPRIIPNISKTSVKDAFKYFCDPESCKATIPWAQHPLKRSFERYGLVHNGSPIIYNRTFPIEYLNIFDDEGLEEHEIGYSYHQSAELDQYLNDAEHTQRMLMNFNYLVSDICDCFGQSSIPGLAAFLSKDNEMAPSVKTNESFRRAVLENSFNYGTLDKKQ